MRVTNEGLKALTVESEQIELQVIGTKPSMQCAPFEAPNHNPECKVKHLLLRYAYTMPAYKDKVPALPNWHVLQHSNPKYSPDSKTTLSMRGLKEWGFVR